MKEYQKYLKEVFEGVEWEADRDGRPPWWIEQRDKRDKKLSTLPSLDSVSGKVAKPKRKSFMKDLENKLLYKSVFGKPSKPRKIDPERKLQNRLLFRSQFKKMKEWSDDETPEPIPTQTNLDLPIPTKNYQKILNANVIKLNNAMIKAREAAEMIGIAIHKGAVLQDQEEIIKKIQLRAKGMVDEISGKYFKRGE